MDVCGCCQKLISQLEDHFKKGNDYEFYKVRTNYKEIFTCIFNAKNWNTLFS